MNDYNGLSFVNGLNSRLKRILFINDIKRMHYDQYMALCYLVTFKFSDFDQFLDKVNEYIVTYKNMVNGKSKKVNESDSEE